MARATISVLQNTYFPLKKRIKKVLTQTIFCTRISPVNITTTQLEAKLAAVKGNTFANITTVTDARLRKTGNPFGTVYKRSNLNVSLGWHYKNAVQRQQAREGQPVDFTPQPRKWGQRREGTPLVDHKGKVYAEAKPEKVFGTEYFHVVDGEEIPLTKEDVTPFLPQRKKPATQDSIEKEIFCRDYALASIKHIAMEGEQFTVVD